MNRRDFLAAAPLAGAPAAKADTSPIVAKVREWQSYHHWIENTPLTEAECDAHCDGARAIEDQVMAMEVTGPVDLLAVLYMLTQSGEYLRGSYREIDAVVGQIEAAIGV